MNKKFTKASLIVVFLLILSMLTGCLMIPSLSPTDKKASTSASQYDKVYPAETVIPESESNSKPIETPENPENIESPSELKVHFIDVGQGDSILIEQGNKTMLIDAGERDKGTVVTKYLNSLHIDNIDYLIGTHPHSDHIGGLATVINSVSVSNAIIPDIEHTTKTYETFIDALINKEVNTLPAQTGDTYTLGNASFEILAPIRDDYDDLNNWSVVIKLTYGEKSFLFTGDAESLAENDMINSNRDLSADVLKVGHHGSTTSSTLKFLKKVSPKYAIISCGVDNSYGHPDPMITKRLANMDITTYSTHTSGTVTVTCDGKTIDIKTEK